MLNPPGTVGVCYRIPFCLVADAVPRFRECVQVPLFGNPHAIRGALLTCGAVLICRAILTCDAVTCGTLLTRTIHRDYKRSPVCPWEHCLDLPARLRRHIARECRSP